MHVAHLGGKVCQTLPHQYQDMQSGGLSTYYREGSLGHELRGHPRQECSNKQTQLYTAASTQVGLPGLAYGSDLWLEQHRQDLLFESFPSTV